MLYIRTMEYYPAFKNKEILLLITPKRYFGGQTEKENHQISSLDSRNLNRLNALIEIRMIFFQRPDEGYLEEDEIDVDQRGQIR